MWLYLLFALLVGLCFFGGIFAGGVFTIVLVPLAVIAFLSALAYALAAGAAKQRSGGGADPAQGARGPATRTSQTTSRRAPSSPEQLVDARRGQQ